jgi:hypothetical protein
MRFLLGKGWGRRQSEVPDERNYGDVNLVYSGGMLRFGGCCLILIVY